MTDHDRVAMAAERLSRCGGDIEMLVGQNRRIDRLISAILEASAILQGRPDPGPSFTCPVCSMTSHHPEDARHRYCGNCHEFHPRPSRPSRPPTTQGML